MLTVDGITLLRQMSELNSLTNSFWGKLTGCEFVHPYISDGENMKISEEIYIASVHVSLGKSSLFISSVQDQFLFSSSAFPWTHIK